MPARAGLKKPSRTNHPGTFFLFYTRGPVRVKKDAQLCDRLGTMAYAQQEVDFQRLNMGKFVLYGAGIFSVRGPARGPLSLQAARRTAAPTDGAAPRAGPHDVPVPAVRHQDAADGAGGRAAGPMGAARGPARRRAAPSFDVAALRRAHARRPRAPAGRCAGCPAGGCHGRRTGAVPGVHHGRGRRHTRARGAPLRRLRAPRERLAPRRKAPAAAAAAAGPEQPACWRPPCAGAGRARAGAALRPGRRRGAACEAGSAGPGGRDSIG